MNVPATPPVVSAWIASGCAISTSIGFSAEGLPSCSAASLASFRWLVPPKEGIAILSSGVKSRRLPMRSPRTHRLYTELA